MTLHNVHLITVRILLSCWGGLSLLMILLFIHRVVGRRTLNIIGVTLCRGKPKQ